jgi:hypothetical protein
LPAVIDERTLVPKPPLPVTKPPDDGPDPRLRLTVEPTLDADAPLLVPNPAGADPPDVECRTIEVADSWLVAVALACGGAPNGFPGAFAPWWVFAAALPAAASASQPAPTTPAEKVTARPVHTCGRSTRCLAMLCPPS